jgi:hypothetical protein
MQSDAVEYAARFPSNAEEKFYPPMTGWFITREIY